MCSSSKLFWIEKLDHNIGSFAKCRHILFECEMLNILYSNDIVSDMYLCYLKRFTLI